MVCLIRVFRDFRVQSVGSGNGHEKFACLEQSVSTIERGNAIGFRHSWIIEGRVDEVV